MANLLGLNSKFVLYMAILLVGLAGCSSSSTKHVEAQTIAPDTYPVILAVGYAPISVQKGANESTKMLMALKASKLDAYRELAEQVYGQRIEGGQSVASLILQDTRLDSSVQGVIRGAKVVKSYPVGNDTYATELELDFKLVNDIYFSTARPKQIKKVHKY